MVGGRGMDGRGCVCALGARVCVSMLLRLRQQATMPPNVTSGTGGRHRGTAQAPYTSHDAMPALSTATQGQNRSRTHLIVLLVHDLGGPIFDKQLEKCYRTNS